ncbi:ATP-binding protein [Pleurocapsa sp. PCC 7319]|uniref:ATP-binding protein n=1 Tax=Pleurocapsa sp. PCC 7319 TaxID=118161 RepID=UPI000344EA74|nr:ATP-binding protein [Pleurocapsa sp. PCC 7319]
MNNGSISDKLILVVKDARQDLSKLLNALQLAEYIVLVVQNELDSWTFAKSTQPSFIILDIMMSKMKGWEICQRLKNSPETKQISLILINSSVDIINKVAQLNWKNVDCIAQVSEPADVINLIKTRSQLIAETTSSNNQDSLISNYQLEVANSHLPDSERDLESFAALVSHDLQAPLRSLTMFTELLVREYQDDLNEGAKKYLERISKSGSRMQTLIANLLAYSRAGKSEQTWVMVDLNQVLHQVTENLHSAIAKSHAKITAGSLPELLINPTEITQLLQNLLENAIKFCGDRSPEIAISVSKQQQKWLFAIADNGIGIAAEFQLQIFQVFKKLHPEDIYSGTGIGLSICQKIVERYGGEIWVESTLGKGSTFYFTIPINAFSPQTNAGMKR